MSAPLHIFVHATVYQAQARGGISRIYNEILPRMCERNPALSIDMYAPPPLRQALPAHPHIHPINFARRDLKPRRLWSYFWRLADKVRFTYALRKDAIWQATYYTLPPRKVRAAVVTVYDLIHYRFPDLYNTESAEQLRQRQKTSIQSADLVIAISKTTAQDISDFCGVPLHRVKVIPLAHSTVFRLQKATEHESPAPRPFILFVGLRSKYKNFGVLAQAYSSWSKREQIDLVVASPSPWDADEIELMRDLNIENRVRLVTNVNDGSLTALYNQASAFIYPSLWEGFGIPLLEAMACGCPVIASRIASTVEIAEDYPIYFEGQNAESLQHALDIAITEGRDSERTRGGLKHVEGYSWDLTADQTAAAYAAL